MDNIHVVVRVRPLNNREITANQGISWMVKENSIVQCTNSGKPIPSNTYAFGMSLCGLLHHSVTN